MSTGDGTLDYKQLLECVRAIVWRADARTFQTTFASKEAEEILGYPLEDWTTVPGFWAEHVHPEDRDWVTAYTAAQIREHRRHELDYRMIAADGRTVWLRNIVNVVVKDGVPVELVGVTVDISDHKRAEIDSARLRRQLARSTRATVLGELAASLAHELNQPLGAIVANAESARQLVASGGGASKQTLQSLEDIRADALRAAAVISNMQAMLRQEPFTPKPVDVAVLFDTVVNLTRPMLTSRGVEFTTRVAHDLPTVLGDSMQLQQVLMNLVFNAFDAMESGVRRPQVMITVQRRDASSLEIAVADTGTGIAAERLPDVFEPFWTTRSQGTGIGLTICRRIVETHGGSITAVNNPEGGATFSFTLPTAPEARAS